MVATVAPQLNKAAAGFTLSGAAGCTTVSVPAVAVQPVESVTEQEPAQQPIRSVELWDLVSAFGRLMRETLALAPQQIVLDETPLQVYMEMILEQLQRESRVQFSVLFTPPYTRGRFLGLFLAILELIKGRQLIAEQPEPFGDIWLCRVVSEASRGE